MMKQTRIIRISFLICTICMVAAFWSGFYFGESQLKADTAPVQTASCPDTDSKKSSTEEKKNITLKKIPIRFCRKYESFVRRKILCQSLGRISVRLF